MLEEEFVIFTICCKPTSLKAIAVVTQKSLLHFRYRLYLTNSKYEMWKWPKHPAWFHMVWVINELGQGFHVYTNGTFVTSYSASDGDRSGSPPTGKVVVGKKYDGVDDFYSSLTVDEFSLWNRKLTAQEIQDIYSIPTS